MILEAVRCYGTEAEKKNLSRCMAIYSFDHGSFGSALISFFPMSLYRSIFSFVYSEPDMTVLYFTN